MLTAAAVILSGAAFCQLQADPKPAPSLDFSGSVQIQAQRALWDNGTDDNLDDFWGRANLSAAFKAADFQSLINIRMFPEGWGFEALSLNVKDSLVAQQKVTPIARFMIEQAWVKYVFPFLDLRLGRFFTTTSKTLHLGNYLDQNPGPGFQARLSYHHAAEGVLKLGPSTIGLLLGAGDKNLNTGYLRLLGSVGLLNEKALTINAGLRANVFDRAYNPDAAITPRFMVGLDYQIIKGLKPFVEIGIIDTASAKDENGFIVPVVIGTSIPAGKILDAVIVEIEILSDRTARDLDGETQDLPIHWNLYIDKKLGTRTRLQAGLFSDAAASSPGDIRFALRYTGSLK